MSTAWEGQPDCVIDASAAIKLFVVEPLSEQAAQFFLVLAARPGARLYVPNLFFSECAYILWKYVRRLHYPLERAREDLAGLKALGLHSIGTDLLVEDALEIAVNYQISAYDACYIGLARRLDLPLLTADEALIRKLTGLNRNIRWLGDVPLPPPGQA